MIKHVIASVFVVMLICALTPGVNSKNVPDEEDQNHRILMASSPGWTYQEPPWWSVINAEFTGVNLKRCFKREFPPTVGDLCATSAKTCFFGNQDCPGVGPYPQTKCFCDGNGSPGNWSCTSEPCPGGYPSLPPTPSYTPPPVYSTDLPSQVPSTTPSEVPSAPPSPGPYPTTLHPCTAAIHLRHNLRHQCTLMNHPKFLVPRHLYSLAHSLPQPIMCRLPKSQAQRLRQFMNQRHHHLFQKIQFRLRSLAQHQALSSVLTSPTIVLGRIGSIVTTQPLQATTNSCLHLP